jgi:hypothetical protein
VIDVSEGKSKVLSSNELTKINAGQKIILAQANVDSNNKKDDLADLGISTAAAALLTAGAIIGSQQGSNEASTGQ